MTAEADLIAGARFKCASMTKLKDGKTLFRETPVEITAVDPPMFKVLSNSFNNPDAAQKGSEYALSEIGLAKLK